MKEKIDKEEQKRDCIAFLKATLDTVINSVEIDYFEANIDYEFEEKSLGYNLVSKEPNGWIRGNICFRIKEQRNKRRTV